ncbi:hypothetical protein L7F22_007689 [Adiantum nelumboides]|nr:hypothetical protein [Adiantum nelumboides]
MHGKIFAAFYVSLLKAYKGDPPQEQILDDPPELEGPEAILQPENIIRHEDKILHNDTCSKGDISIVQGQSSSMPSGIPTFSVEIINMCVVGCVISNVHIACGWFASAKLVNPKVFRRIKFNDCLVNNGAPIKGGESISFQYSNSFQYPLKVLSAFTCH